jgi:restriction system protein
MNLILFSFLVAGISAFIIIKMLKKEIPLIVDKHKNKWKAEQHNKEQIKKYKEKEDKKINEATSERKKEELKIRRSQMYKDNIQKGKNYEKFISNYFKEQGYKVKEHGLIYGKKDKGIDIIVMKDKEVTLIQCKNWKANSKKRINHIMIKEFLGNCATFIEKNKDKANKYTIKKLYIVSNDILENNAKNFIKENKEIVKYKVIPFNDLS